MSLVSRFPQYLCSGTALREGREYYQKNKVTYFMQAMLTGADTVAW
jgi:hypothetical protein